jgi:predicted RNase H-like HicB family nuclease
LTIYPTSAPHNYCARIANILQYLIVIQKVSRNYSANSPDLPGCAATGKTQEETTRNMHEAIELHVQGLREDKLPFPGPSSFAETLIVAI